MSQLLFDCKLSYNCLAFILFQLLMINTLYNLYQSFNLSTIDVWSQTSLCCGGYPTHWRTFSKVPGLHPLDEKHFTQSWWPQICPNMYTLPLMDRITLTVHHCSVLIRQVYQGFFSFLWQKQQQPYYLKCHHCWWKYNEAKKSILKMEKGLEWGKGSDCVNEDGGITRLET